MTIGQLRIPEEFLLPFEKDQINETLGSERRLIPAHLHPDFKDNPTLMATEIEKRKRQMTLLIGAFVISKVFVQDIFNNRHVLDSLFEDVAKNEQIYFHFYGMTLVALLTDLIFKRFGIELLDQDEDDRSSL